MGKFGAAVLDNALHYLGELREAVVRIRTSAPSPDVDTGIAAIRIEDCLAPRVEPTAFEREWHRRNLDAISAQSVFALDAALASQEHHA
jgi:hypothetical protein